MLFLIFIKYYPILQINLWWKQWSAFCNVLLKKSEFWIHPIKKKRNILSLCWTKEQIKIFLPELHQSNLQHLKFFIDYKSVIIRSDTINLNMARLKMTNYSLATFSCICKNKLSTAIHTFHRVRTARTWGIWRENYCIYTSCII